MRGHDLKPKEDKTEPTLSHMARLILLFSCEPPWLQEVVENISGYYTGANEGPNKQRAHLPPPPAVGIWFG